MRWPPQFGARIAGVAVAAAAAVGIVHGSHVPLSVSKGSGAVLRIAWSARPERVEACRTLSDAELEALPEHMRQRTVCEGTTARYHLEVRRDDLVIATSELRGGGLRGDRQLYVYRELPIPSGAADFTVRLVRLDSTVSRDAMTSDVDRARDQRLADLVPAHLELRERVTLAPREVLLVTYDRETRRLRSVRGARALDQR